MTGLPARRITLVSAQVRMMPEGYEVYDNGVGIAHVARGYDGLWSVFDVYGKYISGHWPDHDAAVAATAVIAAPDRIRPL